MRLVIITMSCILFLGTALGKPFTIIENNRKRTVARFHLSIKDNDNPRVSELLKGFSYSPFKGYQLPLYTFPIIDPSGPKSQLSVVWTPSDSVKLKLKDFPKIYKYVEENGKKVLEHDVEMTYENKNNWELRETREYRGYPLSFLDIFPWRLDEAENTVTVFTDYTLTILYPSLREREDSRKIMSYDQGLDSYVLNYRSFNDLKIVKERRLLKGVSRFSSNARFFKFSVTERGIYKISYNEVKNLLGPDDFDMDHVCIYYGGGKPFSKRMKTEELERFGEIPVVLEGSTKEDENIYFYCEALRRVDYYPEIEKVTSIFDEENCYWLVYQPDIVSRKAEIINSESVNSSLVKNNCKDLLYFGEERVVQYPEIGGTRWLWREIDVAGGENSFTWKGDLEEPSEGGTSRIELTLCRKPGSLNTKYQIYVNGMLVVDNVNLINMNPGAIYFDVENSFFKKGMNEIKFAVIGENSGSYYVDNLVLKYNKKTDVSKGCGLFIEEEKENVELTNMKNDDYLLFRATDDFQAARVLPEVTGNNKAAFVSEGENQYYYFEYKEDSKKIASFEEVEWKYLRDLNRKALYVMITPKVFQDEAKRLASYYANRDGINVEVVLLEWIYNEFGYGLADVNSIRNFLYYGKKYWSGEGGELEYVLLFGDGHWDNLGRYTSNLSLCPVYELGVGASSDVCDDYFTYFLDESGEMIDEYPGLSIGRLPLKNKTDAKNVVDKIIGFQERGSEDYWRQNIVISVDDEINPERRNELELFHVQNTENYIVPKLPGYLIQNKVYLMSYSSSEKHLASENLYSELSKGLIFFNYVGHGSPVRLAHESIIHANSLGELENQSKPFLLYASACKVGYYDKIDGFSLAEMLVLTRNKGAMGVISATRDSYPGSNESLNGYFVANAFSGSMPIGRALKEAKMSYRNVSNNRRYQLLGDPYLSLLNRDYYATLTDVNDTLYGGENYSYQGKIRPLYSGNDGSPDQSTVLLQLFDSPNEEKHYFNDGNKEVSYMVGGNPIFRGKVSIDNQKIQGGLNVPFDTKKNSENASIVLYGPGEEEIFGYEKNLKISFREGGENDTIPPEIKVLLDGEEIERKALVYSGAVLRMEFYDENGINMAGMPGHQIYMEIDDDPTSRIDLTSEFSYETDSFQKGYLEWELQSLEVGNHTLKIKCFDNHNNEGEKNIEILLKKESEVVLKDVFNYPNPFKNQTQFVFFSNTGGEVTIEVFVLTGRRIIKLENFAQPGENIVPWDGRDWMGDCLSNGTYFYKVTLKDYESGKKKSKMGKLVKLN